MDLTAPNLIYEKSLIIFLVLTVAVGGGAAWMTGRAIARGWKPFRIAAAYVLLLAAAVRFLHWAVFHDTPREGTLLSLHYFVVDLIVMTVLAWFGYRITRTTQMVSQYRWLYERTSLLSWQAKR